MQDISSRDDVEAGAHGAGMAHWTIRFKERMDEIELSPLDLSAKSGVTEHSIKKYRDGKVDQPRGKTMARLANALGVRVEWLRFGTLPKLLEGNEVLTTSPSASTIPGAETSELEERMTAEIDRIWEHMGELRKRLDLLQSALGAPEPTRATHPRKGPSVSET
jgi:transcriptional regulator with XRE-family HTH domain